MNKTELAKFFIEQASAMSNAAHLPSYKLLQFVIMAGLEQGIWKAGGMLPPERDIAEACSLSVGTVKRAMLNLTHEGLLFRRQGSGTFVAGASFNRVHRRYYLFLDKFGSKESENSVSLHSVKKIPANREINSLLHLSRKTELYEMVRVFREENHPLVIARSYLSAKEFNGLESIPPTRFEHVPLFIMLEEDYEVTTLGNDELFGISTATQQEAELLDTPEGSPLLLIKTIAYTHKDRPFEYRLSHCLTSNKFVYRSMR